MKDIDYKSAFLTLHNRLRELYSFAASEANNMSEYRTMIRVDNATPPKATQDAKIVASVANGCTASETGNMIGISHRTVEAHLASLRRKYGVSNTYQLIAVFFRNGWIK